MSPDCVNVTLGVHQRDFTLVMAQEFVDARQAADEALDHGETVDWADLRAEIGDV